MMYKKLSIAILSAAFCTAPFALLAELKHMTLKEAITAKAVSIIGIGNGGARGKCLTLELTNHTKEPMNVTVDPAMIFVPSDTNYQNLVAAGNESIALGPGGCGEVSIETFCGKSYASGPMKGLSYKFWKQGDGAMIRTMDYIRENGFLNNLGQNAVWSFTNGHSLSRIYDPVEKDRSRLLVEYVARQRHMPVPEYFTTYEMNNTPGVAMVRPNTAKHYVEMYWENEKGMERMLVNVYKEDGTLYREVQGNEVCTPTDHTVTVKFDPKVDEGNFYVLLKDVYGTVYDRKSISVGID